MPLTKHQTLLLFILSIFSISNTMAATDFEQKMLSVNKENKKVTFTIYHFSDSKSVTLETVDNNLEDTAKKNNGMAAISASAQTDIAYKSGKFIFPENTSYFIKNGTIVSPPKSLRTSKHTFILTEAKGRHAICYSPSLNEAELGYALQQFLASSRTKFASVVIVDSGNQCSFYKTNGKYHPYYLKELKKPAKALLIK